jgi:glycosyltransferase involved in cell wall biosynthesis
MNKKSYKKAAVYDRWLHALGGGEQVAFAYAMALRDLGYKTELLTHKQVDLKAAEDKMNVDLHDIEIRYLPNLLDFQLSQYTEDYDVFVANSYLDYIPNRSKFGILSIFFPSKINISVYEFLKRAYIVPSLRKFFIYPSRYEGFRYDESVGGLIFKWLGKESRISFNQNIKSFRLYLNFSYLAISCLDQVEFYFGRERILPSERVVDIYTHQVHYIFVFPKPTKGNMLTIKLPENEYSDTVALTSIFIPSYRYIFYNIFKRLFPRLEMRLHGGPSVTRLSDIESYDKILTISEFSRKWISKYWHLNSEILYPPVNTKNFLPAKQKKNIIVHIGRFFVTGHSKKQLEMTRAFKTLVDDGVKDWELHFIGSVAEGEIHQRYLETVKKEASGYPVFFHIGASFRELKELLSYAKIYWHATGLDEDAERYPIRLEHFGITTIEAMASGCVPIVINLGGQSEIVTDDCGYRWNTRDELIKFTKKMITDNTLWKEKSQKAIERSQIFNTENFKSTLSKSIPLEKPKNI